MKSINYISSRIDILNLNELRYIVGGDGHPTSVEENDNDTPDIKA